MPGLLFHSFLHSFLSWINDDSFVWSSLFVWGHYWSVEVSHERQTSSQEIFSRWTSGFKDILTLSFSRRFFNWVWRWDLRDLSEWSSKTRNYYMVKIAKKREVQRNLISFSLWLVFFFLKVKGITASDIRKSRSQAPFYISLRERNKNEVLLFWERQGREEIDFWSNKSCSRKRNSAEALEGLVCFRVSISLFKRRWLKRSLLLLRALHPISVTYSHVDEWRLESFVISN